MMKRSILLGLLLLGGILLGVRQLRANEGVEVRPMSEIYETTPEIVDITATSARFQFVTTIPIACALVWGESADFGNIATDPSMNGGALIDHNIQLGGLQPDTEYHWRIQGSSADGTIYVDEDYTFHTLPLSMTNEINLASLAGGATILGVSSNFGGADNNQAWGANSAIDENASTAWSSNGDGNDAWIEVGLIEEGMPHAIEVWSRFMTNGTAQIFEFTVTTDKNETFGPFTLPEGIPTENHRFAIAPTMSVASMRLDVTDSNGGNTGLIEFGVFAEQEERGFLPIIMKLFDGD